MKRRQFIGLLGSATLWPLPAMAQQRPARIGILIIGTAPAARDLALVQELARMGYVEGRNIAYEVRSADGNSGRLPQLARELVAARPDILVGSTSTVAAALMEATSAIPIVMTVVGDPVVLGLSASMSRPSRNVTGFTNSSVSLAAKRLDLLRELVPGLRKVAYVWVPENPLMRLFSEQVKTAAETLGINLVSLPLAAAADIGPAFQAAEKEQVNAVLIEADALTVRMNGTIIDECLVRDLPAMHTWPFEVHNGALISYGPTNPDNYPRAAVYIDRILKGAKIADLPFEEPTQIKLALNLRTARSIKLAVPPALLARADEIVE
jgi:putative ABC transport system substrate-binding protein